MEGHVFNSVFSSENYQPFYQIVAETSVNNIAESINCINNSVGKTMNYTYVVYNTKKTYLHLQSDRIEIL
jgi:hypothetical protein